MTDDRVEWVTLADGSVVRSYRMTVEELTDAAMEDRLPDGYITIVPEGAVPPLLPDGRR